MHTLKKGCHCKESLVWHLFKLALRLAFSRRLSAHNRRLMSMRQKFHPLFCCFVLSILGKNGIGIVGIGIGIGIGKCIGICICMHHWHLQNGIWYDTSHIDHLDNQNRNPPHTHTASIVMIHDDRIQSITIYYYIHLLQSSISYINLLPLEFHIMWGGVPSTTIMCTTAHPFICMIVLPSTLFQWVISLPTHHSITSFHTN